MHLLETIGNTPLIELRNTTASTEGRLLFKYERGNPGGSIKDRPALFIVTEAEKRGLLKPGGNHYRILKWKLRNILGDDRSC